MRHIRGQLRLLDRMPYVLYHDEPTNGKDMIRPSISRHQALIIHQLVGRLTFDDPLHG